MKPSLTDRIILAAFPNEHITPEQRDTIERLIGEGVALSDAPKGGSGDFSIGSDVWPGISKLMEECGEVVQVAGKLLGAKGERAHWDGSDLKDRLESELGDLSAAIQFVIDHCGLTRAAVIERMIDKQILFEKWHAAKDPTPTAALAAHDPEAAEPAGLA